MMTTTMGGAGQHRRQDRAMGWSIERVARRMAQLWSTLTMWSERRRQRTDLANMPDAMLKDIGITRADVWREVNKPFWRE